MYVYKPPVPSYPEFTQLLPVHVILIPNMSAYDKVRSQHASTEEHYNTTTARIQKIQAHLENAKRGEKLSGKVCIITGVGSLKGIGLVA